MDEIELGEEFQEEFKHEAAEFLVQLEDALLNLEISPDDTDIVNSVLRTLHSLKGAGMMFGWDALAAFIHQVETTLVRVRNDGLAVTPELVALTLLVTDHIRKLLEQPEKIEPMRGTELLAAITQLTINTNSEYVTATNGNHALFPVSQVSTAHVTTLLDEWPAMQATAALRNAATTPDTLRVPVKQINYLIEQVNKLVITQTRLSKVMATAINPFAKSLLEDLRSLTIGLRDTTVTLRMSPIGTLFRRFRRVVHDLARELGKTVELTMSGEAITMDKLLIDGLHDPLLHIIRNAIDHGIEHPEQRIAAGKPIAGRLRLDAQHSAAEVVITIEDDGRGLDCDAIRVKAENYGLLWPGQEVSTDELFNCIFHAGFSTAVEVTSISGRGVGMDVVKRAINNLHGLIKLKSDQGRGTTVILTLPLTLDQALHLIK